MNLNTHDDVEIRIRIRPSDLAKSPEDAQTAVGNATYHLAVAIFEAMGQHGYLGDTGPGILACHGHHAAQEVAEIVKRLHWKYDRRVPK